MKWNEDLTKAPEGEDVLIDTGTVKFATVRGGKFFVDHWQGKYEEDGVLAWMTVPARLPKLVKAEQKLIAETREAAAAKEDEYKKILAMPRDARADAMEVFRSKHVPGYDAYLRENPLDDGDEIMDRGL